MAGFPVTLSDNGTPFVSVTSGGAPATISPNGKPIKIVANNAPPLVIDGLNPPAGFNWQPIDVTAGINGTRFIGYSDGGGIRPKPAFGSISGQPSDKTELLAIYYDNNNGFYFVVFSGDWLSEMNNLTLAIGGVTMTLIEYEIVSGDTWLVYNGVVEWVDGGVYQIEFG